jgi:WD40 repeat protein
VILLLIAESIIFPLLLQDAPHLPEEYAQTHTHLATFKVPLNQKRRQVINTIAFSPDGQTLAIGIAQDVHLWDVNTGKHLSILKGHSGLIRRIAFSPDGKTLASVSRNRERSSIHLQKIAHYTIRLWDIKTRILRLAFTRSISPLTTLEFSPNSTKLLIATQHGFIDVYDSDTGRRELENFLYVHDGILNKIGTIAFAASPDNTIITRWVWKADGFMPSRTPTTEVYRRFSHGNWFDEFRLVGDSAIGLNRGMDRQRLFLIPNTYRVNALAFSLNGKILASGSQDKESRLYDVATAKIQLWDPDTGQLLHTFNSPGGWINLLTFSPDGNTLASVGKRWWNKIFIWDMENYRLLSIITTGNRKIKALQFAPDSITLVSAHTDGTVHLWDITGRTKRGK